MFCPQCKAEYRAGFLRCSDCAVELVDHLPVDASPHRVDAPAKHAPYGFETGQLELVVIRTYQSGLDAELAKTVLEAAGIESMIRGDDIARRYSALSLTQGVELLVRSQDAEDADKILNIDATEEENPIGH